MIGQEQGWGAIASRDQVAHLTIDTLLNRRYKVWTTWAITDQGLARNEYHLVCAGDKLAADALNTVMSHPLILMFGKVARGEFEREIEMHWHMRSQGTPDNISGLALLYRRHRLADLKAQSEAEEDGRLMVSRPIPKSLKQYLVREINRSIFPD